MCWRSQISEIPSAIFAKDHLKTCITQGIIFHNIACQHFATGETTNTFRTKRQNFFVHCGEITATEGSTAIQFFHFGQENIQFISSGQCPCLLSSLSLSTVNDVLKVFLFSFVGTRLSQESRKENRLRSFESDLCPEMSQKLHVQWADCTQFEATGIHCGCMLDTIVRPMKYAIVCLKNNVATVLCLWRKFVRTIFHLGWSNNFGGKRICFQNTSSTGKKWLGKSASC